MTKQFTFGKRERLSHKKHIDALFNEGQSFIIKPFKIFYKTSEHVALPELKILLAVPKRKFKKAVDRNHIRRLIREVYRINKNTLSESVNSSIICLHVGFVYIGDKADIALTEIEKPIIDCLERINRILKKGEWKDKS